MMVNEAQDQGDPSVIVHVRKAEDTCNRCGSSNVLTVHAGEPDSPVWVQMCSDCDERVWSLDADEPSA